MSKTVRGFPILIIDGSRGCCFWELIACFWILFILAVDLIFRVNSYQHIPDFLDFCRFAQRMKFPWTGANELATSLSIGDRIEYRRRGFFSFRATVRIKKGPIYSLIFRNGPSAWRSRDAHWTIIRVRHEPKTYGLFKWTRKGKR